jgi:leucyl aminopeptidase
MATCSGVVYFELPNVLATVRIYGRREFDIRPYPEAITRLETLADSDNRIGILMATHGMDAAALRGEILAPSTTDPVRERLRRVLSPALVILRPRLDILALKEAKAVASGLCRDGRHSFVSPDAAMRVLAAAAGLGGTPHPAVAAASHAGEALRYISAQHDSSGLAELADTDLVPLSVDVVDGKRTIYAIASGTTLDALERVGWRVTKLGAEDLPLTSDVFVQPHAVTSRGREVVVLESDARRSYLAVAGGALASFTAGEGAERRTAGHCIGARVLLDVPPGADGTAVGPGDGAVSGARPAASRDGSSAIIRACVRPRRVRKLVDRYSGAVPLGRRGRIESRALGHPGNDLAVARLVGDLERIVGLRVARMPFTFAGAQHFNVEAILPGKEPGVVVVSAHLDSAPGPVLGNPDRLAPGADDDASGMAGVILGAEALARLARLSEEPRREIRFVLFNAEEEGRAGSVPYALACRGAGDAIVGVLQMDMIGYDAHGPDHHIEIHAGSGKQLPAREESYALMEHVARMVSAPGLCTLPLLVDRYPALAAPGTVRGLDRADGKSDHTSFHHAGYAACLIGEDHFHPAEGMATVQRDTAPGYHSRADTVVHPRYNADIARVVAATAWSLSARPATRVPAPIPDTVASTATARSGERMPADDDVRVRIRIGGLCLYVNDVQNKGESNEKTHVHALFPDAKCHDEHTAVMLFHPDCLEGTTGDCAVGRWMHGVAVTFPTLGDEGCDKVTTAHKILDLSGLGDVPRILLEADEVPPSKTVLTRITLKSGKFRRGSAGAAWRLNGRKDPVVLNTSIEWEHRLPAGSDLTVDFHSLGGSGRPTSMHFRPRTHEGEEVIDLYFYCVLPSAVPGSIPPWENTAKHPDPNEPACHVCGLNHVLRKPIPSDEIPRYHDVGDAGEPTGPDPCGPHISDLDPPPSKRSNRGPMALVHSGEEVRCIGAFATAEKKADDAQANRPPE